MDPSPLHLSHELAKCAPEKCRAFAIGAVAWHSGQTHIFSRFIVAPHFRHRRLPSDASKFAT